MSRARNQLASLFTAAICLISGGCQSYQASEFPTPKLAIGNARPQVWLVMKDGTVFELRHASMNGDSIRGENILTGREIGLHADSVRTFEVRKYDGQKTVLAVIGSLAALVGGWLLLLSGSDWGNCC